MRYRDPRTDFRYGVRHYNELRRSDSPRLCVCRGAVYGIIRGMEHATTVRPATLGDAERIFALIGRNTDMLVPRSLGSVVENIDRFFVAEGAGSMAGCAAYQIHPEIGDAEAATVEIVSLVVKSVFRRRGIGRPPSSVSPE